MSEPQPFPQPVPPVGASTPTAAATPAPGGVHPDTGHPLTLSDSVLQLRDPDAGTGAPLPPALPEGIPPGLAERYELLGEVGRGGMGCVLRGRDRILGRDLAIKVMLGQHDHHRPEEAQRFREEAQVGGQLQHPGVVPVYELGVSADGQPYFTMKLVKGVTLTHLLRQRTDPTRERPRFLGVFLQVCQAVAYAHSRGVIHRDLKPSNVMVGAFGEVQVMDWGLAKVLAPTGAETTVPLSAPEEVAAGIIKVSRPGTTGSATQTGDVLGTPAYMPPEQALGELDRLDERADVFSLGAVLCEVLTGLPPYADRNGSEALRRAQRGDLTDALARLDACGADPELTDLARRCLAAEPAARPRQAGAVARVVEAYLAGVEERSRRAELERATAQARAEEAGATARAERRARRLTLGLAAVALLLVVAGGAGAWMIQQQHAAALTRRREAEQKTRTAMESARRLLEEGWRNNDGAKLAVALAEADKAVKVADSGGAGDDARQEADALRRQAQARVTGARKNAALLAALLNVTAPRETARYKRGESGTMAAVAEPSVDAQFGEAFRRWGLDIDKTPVEESAARLGEQPAAVVQEIVAGLDGWLAERRRQRPAIPWQRLLRLAERLDGDKDSREVRRLLTGGALEREALLDALRKALLPWSALGDVPAGMQKRRLQRLAVTAARSQGPVLGLVTLAHALEGAGDALGAERLLRSAAARQPDQVVLLDALARLMERQRPPHWAEAIEWYRAARTQRPFLGIALGKALRAAGRPVEAEEVLRDAQERQPNNPELSFALGLALHEQQQLQKAETAYRRALALQPDYVAAHNNLGNVLREQQRLGEAVAAYDKALRFQPGDAAAHCNRGLALYEQKQFAEAEAACRRAIDLKPDLVPPYNNLGLTLLAQKRYAEAEAAYRRAIDLQPDFAAPHYNLGLTLRQQKRPTEAETAFRRTIVLKADSAAAHMSLGDALRDQKRSAEAETAYRRALALQPDYPEACLRLGNALGDQKRVAEAETAFRRTLVLKPDSVAAHLSLGGNLRAQKRYAEAEAVFRRAIVLQPDRTEAYLDLGNVLRDQKRSAKAEAVFRKAIELQPNCAAAHNNLGNALADQKRYGAAETACRRALALQPDYAAAHNNLGTVLCEQKRYREGEAAYRRALALQPDYTVAHNNLGSALFGQKRYAEAEAAYRRALELKPDFPEAYNNLGSVLGVQKRHAEAEAAYQKAILLKSDSPEAYNNLGNVLRAQRKLAEAVAVLRRADQLFPHQPLIRANRERTERLLKLDARLAAIRAGKRQPQGAQERLELGAFCAGYRREYVAAAGFLADALAADPRLADDVTHQHRYGAAYVAALAAAGKGEDAGKLSQEERSRLRKQALGWLRADLDAYTVLVAKTSGRQLVGQRLAFWLQDEDLSGVRDKKALAALPAPERQAWGKLWADVAALLKKVADK